MPTVVRLDSAIDAILDALKTRLEAATITPEPPDEPGLLADVASVVIGNRSRPRPRMPALWVFGGEAFNQHNTAAIQETWELPIILVSVVQADQPEDGYRLATSVAARARSVALKDDRRLGLPYVSDINSTAFDPSSQHEIDNRTLYSAAATVTARFQIFEKGD